MRYIHDPRTPYFPRPVEDDEMTKLVSIGPNLFARTKMSVIEQYWEKQAKCPHAKRDPRGKCYACGQERKEA